MKFISVIAFMLFTSNSFASAYDDGKVDQLYTSINGNFGISLVGGTPQSDADNDTCIHGSAWSGFAKSEQTETIISVLMMAKASGKTIRIITDGCHSTWHKIVSVQLLD